MSETEDYDACRGRVFQSQRAAHEAMKQARATADRALDLVPYVCTEGHWHYRPDPADELIRLTEEMGLYDDDARRGAR